MALLSNFLNLFVLSAPWLLLGLLVAGLINTYLPERFLQRHLGEGGFWVTVKAALIGAPMPLCSCGVIPAAVGLRRAGASKSATTAFLVSTPETGVDSVSLSYALLGPFMAVIRPVAAVSSAIVAGLLVGKDEQSQPATTQGAESQNQQTVSTCCTKTPAPAEAVSSCCEAKNAVKSCCDPAAQTEDKAQTSGATESCCTKTAAPEAGSASCCDTQKPKTTSCCGPSNGETKQMQTTHWQKIKGALSFSSGKLLQDTAGWLMVGLVFAALVQTYVPEDWLLQWGSGIWAMLAVILVSIPMYICATASTPIAAGLLLAGVSPGAVLVFMLAGPATNIATLGVVGNELGKRAIVAYLGSVIGVALAFGFLTDYLVERYGFNVAPLVMDEHELLPVWLSYGAAALLGALLMRLALRRLLTKNESTSMA